MKKILSTAIKITACAALCAAVCPQSSAGGKAPAHAESEGLIVYADKPLQSTRNNMIARPDDMPLMKTAGFHAPETVEKTAEKKKRWPHPLRGYLYHKTPHWHHPTLATLMSTQTVSTRRNSYTMRTVTSSARLSPAQRNSGRIRSGSTVSVSWIT